MPSVQTHPRRKPAGLSIDDVSESLSRISLCKSSTFNCAHSPELGPFPDSLTPLFKSTRTPTLSSRSATCPRSLEDLLLGAGERRAVELLKKVDDAVAQKSRLSGILSEPEVLPVPRFMLRNTFLSTKDPVDKAIPIKQETLLEDDADSGLGSSIDDSTWHKLESIRTQEQNSAAAGNARDTRSAIAGSSSSPPTSAVNRSYALATNVSARGLSGFAETQIRQHIIKPILDEPLLKEFHPLVDQVPSKIATKDIATLRDLEKTLIFLAPDYSRSPSAYRFFCETSIRCLHLTVNGVHESDRCLPSDRPYSTGYFIDLVEQIRRYAAILAATRAKQARGEELDEMDADPTDQIELKGGVSHDGKPAFLARTKKGVTVNLATNKPLAPVETSAVSMKRPMDESAADDVAAERSMARRKKGAPILTYDCPELGCTKHFKRPCDLSKHRKTHDRPFKCPEEDCKYHTHGWPTEKERDRHYNDKHSDSPTMYKCMDPTCPYTSKRESNCKQHMEKTHGIEYVRMKNNGKGKGKARASISRVPIVQPPSAPDSATDTPMTSIEPSPLMGYTSDNSVERSDSLGSAQSVLPHAHPSSTGFDPAFQGHFNTDFFSAGLSTPITPEWLENAYVGSSASAISPYQLPDFTFGNPMETDLSPSYGQYTYQHNQQLTPASSNQYSGTPYSASHPSSGFQSAGSMVHDTFSPDVSPGAAQDLTLTEAMQMDEGFGGDFSTDQDFPLFAGTGLASDPLFGSEPVYQDTTGMHSVGSQFEAVDLNTLFPELKNSR